MSKRSISLFASVLGATALGLNAQMVAGLAGEAGGVLNQQAVATRNLQPVTPKTTERNVVVFAGDRVIPQVADGAGWKTSFTVVNLENHPVTFQVYFFNDNGGDLVLPIVGQGNIRGMNISLFQTQSTTFETSGLASGVTTGWALIGPTPFTDTVGGLAVFRQRVSGRPDSEAVVPIVNQFDSHFVLLFDNTGGFVTSAAFANPTLGPVVIPVVIRDETGTVLDQRTISLNGFGHAAFVVPDLWPTTRGKRGAIEFLATGFGVGALGLRFNPSGAFTSFHVLTNLAWR